MRTFKRTIIIVAAVLWGLLPQPVLLAADPDDSAAQEPAPAPAPPAAITQPAEQPEPAQPEEPVTPEPVHPKKLPKHRGHRGPHVQKDAIVEFGRDVELKSGDSADAVIVIGGSANIQGKVNDAAVAILGDLNIEGGDIGDAAVAVLGNIKAGKGANIRGDAVSVGGTLETDEDATIGGEKVSLGIGGVHAPWLRSWFVHCALMMRPLAPQVGWIWGVVGIVFLLYLLVAAAFPRPVLACVNELTARPATTFLMGLLTKLLLPLGLLILAITGIGLFVIPFVIAAVILGAIVGKVALLEWLGLKLGRQFASKETIVPVAGLVIGAVILALVYMVPVVGLVAFGIVSVWGLGGAVTAAFGGLRREMPAKGPKLPTEPGAPAPPAFPSAPMETSASTSGPAMAGLAAATAAETAAPPITAPAILPETLSYPKAGFWERMGAGFLDAVIVAIGGAVVGPLFPLVALAYFSAMWAWKGTTIGGIVLGLKVVRYDGHPVSFPVALVRSLAAAFSIVVLFLGFLWIAWDPEKQGWHDRIAGTVVLKLPRGTPLLCL